VSIKISEHFAKNWRDRVGGEPDPAMICAILGRSRRLQTGGQRIIGGRYYKTLSIFWSHDDAVVIKMDPESGTVVTVITPEMGRKEA